MPPNSICIPRLEGSFPQVPTRPAYAFEEIYLQNNLLTSNIPPSIGNLLSLEVLHLHGNELTSSIPSELARLTQLVELTLQVSNRDQNQNLTSRLPLTYSPSLPLGIHHIRKMS